MRLIARLCSIACSLTFAESNRLRARSRLESSCWICAMTRWASACFALIEGSAVAPPAAIAAAARARTMTGACRFRVWMTSPDVHPAPRHRASRTSQGGDASRAFGCWQPVNALKVAANWHEAHKTFAQILRHKLAEGARFLWYGPALRGRPKDTIRGAARRRHCGARLRCGVRSLGPGAARAGIARAAERTCVTSARGDARPVRARCAPRLSTREARSAAE